MSSVSVVNSVSQWHQKVASLVPRPKQPSCGSLPVSCGEGGSGDVTGGNGDLRWNAGIHNYWLIITFYHKIFFGCFRSSFRSIHANPNKRSDRRCYEGRKLV